MYFCVVLCIVCFVSFFVLFMCICELNYCHQVATQLQLNISYHKKQLHSVCYFGRYRVILMKYVIFFSEFHWITRKDSLRKLTDKYCEEVKQQRLDSYRASLEAQQLDFLRTKVQKLQWIRKEEEECGVKPTVTEKDIEQVLIQLKELELSKENRSKDKAD